jgi:23S rRNA (uridine2552-2'-O)-methyltransferase
MTNTWIQKRKKDQYYRLAKLRGYRSRAAYKLLQTVRTYNLIKPGQKVLDLGSQPGGWLQVCREIVGPEGMVIGIDIKQIEPLNYSNVRLLKIDIYEANIVEKILHEFDGPANVVLSDLAPSIIGAWDVDHARQVDLARRALTIAENVLDHNGNVLIKLFHGPELKKLADEATPLFTNSRLLKPKASRPESSEIYFLGLGFKQKFTQSIPKPELAHTIFLTGLPGTGKTTLVRKLVQYLTSKNRTVGGILSEEVRESGMRIGFKIHNLSTGEEGWLARKNGTGGIRIGAYTVHMEDLEKIGVEALASALSLKPDVIIIDEIGPMEMTSHKFKQNLMNIFDSDTPIIATVRHGSRYDIVEKQKDKSTWYEITRENRDQTYEKLIRHVDTLLTG